MPATRPLQKFQIRESKEEKHKIGTSYDVQEEKSLEHCDPGLCLIYEVRERKVSKPLMALDFSTLVFGGGLLLQHIFVRIIMLRT
jgi:hypothetical protein